MTNLEAVEALDRYFEPHRRCCPGCGVRFINKKAGGGEIHKSNCRILAAAKWIDKQQNWPKP